ncbi:hypothetical protein H8957_010016 [Semnopithecus entellus]
MRLSVCLLLVTLALCCYQANAVVCPALFSEISGFLFINEPVFKLKLAKYDAPPEAVAAILEVKKCTDQISLEKHLLIEKVQVTCLDAMSPECAEDMGTPENQVLLPMGPESRHPRGKYLIGIIPHSLDIPYPVALSENHVKEDTGITTFLMALY